MNQPTIVYLHGVGQGVRKDEWLNGLNEARSSSGRDAIPLNSPRLIVPDYIDLLKGPVPERASRPDQTSFPDVSSADLLLERTAYSRRQRTAADRYPSETESSGLGGFGPGVADFGARATPPWRHLADADHYLDHDKVRFNVLQRVLSAIGIRRDLILVGHSLGSIVAIDLLAHLPRNVKVHRMVTLGSPAGLAPLHDLNPGRLIRKFPHHQVETWLNVYSPLDAVTGGLGITRQFPDAHDIRLNLGAFTHAAGAHFRHPLVESILSDKIDPPTESIRLSSGREVELRPTPDEESVLFGLDFAHHVARTIKDKGKRRRYAEALDDIQFGVHGLLVEKATQERRPIPSIVSTLLTGRAPGYQPHWDEQTGLRSIVVAATTNHITPYEIETEQANVDAIPEMWEMLGWTKAHGTHIWNAAREAMKEFDSVNFGKFALAGVGLAILATGPIGLMAVAPVGLAGGAAITGALAAFGPGGMVGGMLLAGSLVGTGSVTATAALLSNETSVHGLETELVRRMTISLASSKIGLPKDFGNWLLFSEIQSRLAADMAHIEPLSDGDSATMKELRAKVKLIDRAIRWMVEQDLAPSVSASRRVDSKDRTAG